MPTPPVFPTWPTPSRADWDGTAIVAVGDIDKGVSVGESETAVAEGLDTFGDGATATTLSVAVGATVGRRTTTGIGGWVWIGSAVVVG